ncbi:universal stress protein [Oryzifoliimicrobium ureilyticus]|uniref:universal stress protein n=1 Tax=Oryzifoliimicrobium ureilyticus TaxID=3113724 RepID=UPI003076453D
MFSTIVCAIGLGSRKKIEHLVQTSARLLAPGGTLHLVHAVDQFPSTAKSSPDAWATMVVADAEARLAEISRDLLITPVICVRTGRVDQVVLAIAKEVKADLIVMAAHKEDVLDKLFGSVVDHIVHKADCSVYIERPSVAAGA